MPAKRRLPPGARQRAGIVVERLKQEDPEADTELQHQDPFQLLVSVILSAQTTDERVNMVTPILFKRYPTAADLAGADQTELENLIRSTGFFRSKARALREMAQDLVRQYGGEVPPRMEDLVRLRGVGRKKAQLGTWVAVDD